MGHDQKDDSLKVVDKRRFTSGGERRPEEEARSAPEPTVTSTPQPKTAPPPKTKPAQDAQQAYQRSTKTARLQEMDFETLVLTLSTSAMVQLGLVQNPAGGEMPADFDAARQTIDLLGVLQEKTRGNLTSQEKQLLDQVVYELRMAYVSVTGTGRRPPGRRESKAGV